MRLLIIEDEPAFIEKVQAALQQSAQPIELFTPRQVDLDKDFEEGVSHEEQLLARVRGLQQQHQFDIVLLDSDLSRMGNGIAQSMCRQAFQEVGLPVCRYKKKHSNTHAKQLQDLRRTAREGASAVWVPSHLLQIDSLTAKLFPWLTAVEQGFQRLRRFLEADPTLLKKSLGPAGILALALERPSAKADFLGYTGQNFFFFGAPSGEDEDDPTVQDVAVQATQLGYWLLNYILMFPGPILSHNAAAAYLNLQTASFDTAEVQDLVKSARYSGPFHDLDAYYWRDDLAGVLDECDGDIVKARTLQGVALARVDAANPGSSAYLCVLTQEPIAEADAALNPDWIPAGAQVTRIQSRLYDQLGPMLSI